MAVSRLQDSCQFPCVFVCIIDSVHQAVLKCNPAPCLLEVSITRCKHFGKIIFICHRHELPPLLLSRSVQRQRERDLKLFLRKFKHFRNNAAGRYRDVSLTDIKSVLICQDANEFQEIIIIVKRLPGAHDYHIMHSFFCDLLDLVDLPQHL